jgi:hypothetical protein
VSVGLELLHRDTLRIIKPHSLLPLLTRFLLRAYRRSGKRIGGVQFECYTSDVRKLEKWGRGYCALTKLNRFYSVDLVVSQKVEVVSLRGVKIFVVEPLVFDRVDLGERPDMPGLDVLELLLFGVELCKNLASLPDGFRLRLLYTVFEPRQTQVGKSE